MTGRRAWIAGLATAGALLAAPGWAAAATFCVKKPSCVADGGAGRPSVQAALDSAEANGPGRDRVELGPRTFRGAPYATDDTNAVRLVGSGQRRTILTRTGTDSSQTILSLLDDDSRALRLRVRLNDGLDLTGIETPGRVERVRVIGKSESPAQTGVELGPGGTLLRSQVSVRPTGFNNATALRMTGPEGRVRRARLKGNAGAVAFSGTPADPFVGRRLRIVADSVGFLINGGAAELDQATVRTIGNATGVRVSADVVNASLVARHVTVVGEGVPDSFGAIVSASSKGSCGDAELRLRNVILRGFERDISRVEFCAVGTPEASVDVVWSVFDPMKVFETGDGDFTDGPGNKDVNPRFVNRDAGNYHLRRRSPLIDKGQPGLPGPGQSKVDLDGRKRVIDGDGDGQRRRDIGAFERRRPR